ncbi:MAG: hypothetical protein LGB03_05690 [Sulfurovum sp.]|nr:hypothetical protein [Sulfurovum sp.]MCB4752338.1 hypothetical protein [Sulfurovum sp.]MCB4753221.1 hypothetical protein [Sulfurovum sp.]MCB4754357.1 hypothetical protein [Sulfurovum sp.]MCB4761168.1 hypothetical protein [Sulfurovum sp.]
MLFILIKTIHLFAAFIYGGFLITDNLFCNKIKKTFSEDEHKHIRESFMKYVRKVVPPSLIVAVLTGLYLISQVYGPIDPKQGLTWFQGILALKAFLGIWLGLRGFLQVYVGIQPFVFKSHVLPFAFVITIIFLSQFMYLPVQ